MDRRTFIRSIVSATSLIPLSSPGALTPGSYLDPPLRSALPTPDQLAWQDLEVGMFIHFAPNTWQDKELDDLSTPLSQINPELLDTDQWVTTAIELGAQYIVFVAKHVGGFCMWQTDTTDYSIRKTSCAAVVAMCWPTFPGPAAKLASNWGYTSPRETTILGREGADAARPSKNKRPTTLYTAGN